MRPRHRSDDDVEQSGDDTLTYLYFTDGPDEEATRDLIARFDEETGATVDLQSDGLPGERARRAR